MTKFLLTFGKELVNLAKDQTRTREGEEAIAEPIHKVKERSKGQNEQTSC